MMWHRSTLLLNLPCAGELNPATLQPLPPIFNCLCQSCRTGAWKRHAHLPPEQQGQEVAADLEEQRAVNERIMAASKAKRREGICSPFRDEGEEECS